MAHKKQRVQLDLTGVKRTNLMEDFDSCLVDADDFKAFQDVIQYDYIQIDALHQLFVEQQSDCVTLDEMNAFEHKLASLKQYHRDKNALLFKKVVQRGYLSPEQNKQLSAIDLAINKLF